MTLDDLRRLNPRDVGSWPVVPKLGALLILLLFIVFAGYWFDWRNQLEELAQARDKEQELRTAFLDKKKQAVNLEAYRKQLAEIEESFGEMLKQLPNKSEMEALLTDINQAGLGRGLQFELFRPAQKENMSEFYAELPRYRRVRERRFPIVADRDPERHRVDPQHEWRSDAGRGGQNLPLFGRERDRGTTQGRP
jgi:type IV pilus assembly protein PilO